MIFLDSQAAGEGHVGCLSNVFNMHAFIQSILEVIGALWV